jgi:hypothetical protein
VWLQALALALASPVAGSVPKIALPLMCVSVKPSSLPSKSPLMLDALAGAPGLVSGVRVTPCAVANPD